MLTPNHCTLCRSNEVVAYTAMDNDVNWNLYGINKDGVEKKLLVFYRCDVCRLIFKDPQIYLRPELEKKRYQLHQNHSIDHGYERYLNRLLEPVLPHLSYSYVGLDYGCGPNPVLQILLKEKGYKCLAYDPYFFSDPSYLNKKYDFILSSEVVEHFYLPHQSWSEMCSLSKINGLIGIMTQFPPDDLQAFANWYYHKDPTHVSFYSAETFEWLAARYGFQISYLNSESGVVILT